ncbi:unnamed protein product [Lymnaea stagnalis]|uniref:Osteopetrosis-associated transmembrane protein 1 n=1 Tax=Lymnaea stagnalis TaxID=6523 RepID=A0AAV2HHC9_LYMST
MAWKSKRCIRQNMIFQIIISICVYKDIYCQLYKTPVISTTPQVNQTELIDPCETFFNEYMKAVNNFTHCELFSAKPFRLCTSCVEQYSKAHAIFSDLINDPSLSDCNTKYMKSDSIQIIPTVQNNIEVLWTKAACAGCSSDVTINSTTETVTYTVPDDVSMFLNLYHNLTLCLNLTYMKGHFDMLKDDDDDSGNVSTMCAICKTMYESLNDFFNNMDDRTGNGICMDVVDMMNYTRVVWSMALNCSQRSGDFRPVVAITCVVAALPFFFYLSLKLTGKEGLKKLYRQKRLDMGTSLDGSSSSSQPATRGRNSVTHRTLRLSTLT